MKTDKKYRKAISAVNEKRVIKVSFYPSGLSFYVVKSSSRNIYYLIYPDLNYCTCNDFFFNSVLRKKEDKCYHLIAYDIAREKGYIKEIKYRDEELKKFFTRVITGILS